MIFRFFLIFLGALDLALIDQISKWFAHRYFVNPQEITSWLTFRYVENTGIAWSIPLPLAVIIALNILLVILLIFFAWKYLHLERNSTSLAIILILGGAIGNIYDRLVHGYVIDFIAISTWPVFNFADIYICAGVFLSVIFYGIMHRKSVLAQKHDNSSQRDEDALTASDTGS